jgi:hypothetical protein
MHVDSMSRWLIDAVLAIAALETLALIALNLLAGRGLPWRDLLPNLAAGLFLMTGVLVAVEGESWMWLGICLGAAGVAHIADLSRRGFVGVSRGLPRKARNRDGVRRRIG